MSQLPVGFFPRIVTDPTVSSDTLYYMTDDVAAALTRLYWDFYWGRLTESEYNHRAETIAAGSRSRIGMVKNIGAA